MEINIANIPKAIMYFLIGTMMNIVIYYIISPNEANMIGILESLFTAEATTTYVIYIGIMSITILGSLIFPAWMILSKEEA